MGNGDRSLEVTARNFGDFVYRESLDTDRPKTPDVVQQAAYDIIGDYYVAELATVRFDGIQFNVIDTKCQEDPTLPPDQYSMTFTLGGATVFGFAYSPGENPLWSYEGDAFPANAIVPEDFPPETYARLQADFYEARQRGAVVRARPVA